MANAIRIYKSSDTETLDELLTDKQGLDAFYATALRRFDQYESESVSKMIEDLAGQPGVPWSAETVDRFPAFLAEMVPGAANADEILRRGFREAVSLARDQGLPVETFFVTGAGDEFEALVVEGRHVVLFFIVVPGGAGQGKVPAGSHRARARSWVVTSGERPADARRPAHEHLGSGIHKVMVSGRTEPPAHAD